MKIVKTFIGCAFTAALGVTSLYGLLAVSALCQDANELAEKNGITRDEADRIVSKQVYSKAKAFWKK
jgi:hypothetical protein